MTYEQTNLSRSAWFPLFADLQGRNVLVIGGDEVAARKVERLLSAGANIDLVAATLHPRLSAWHAEGRVNWLAKQLAEHHFPGHVFIMVASAEQDDRDFACNWAQQHHVLINVVDQQHVSSAIVPAVVDRSPLMVAIGSGGNAPELARLLRSQIERLLPAHTGALAELAGALKLRIRARFPELPQRRQFLQWLFTGGPAQALAAGQQESAQAQVLRALNYGNQGGGHVSLVGAGPGAPELLTLRALHLIENADTIVFDGLVDERILGYARRDATFVDVSKRPGQVRVSQEEIHSILSAHAAKGEQVVRLKGGDPMIFGRGGEEIAWLRSQGIPYDIVPGITAASACASYAGFPLTQRGLAQSVRFVTGHCERSIDRLDWQALAQDKQTLAFYMSVGQLARIEERLIAHGRAASTPIALVENGSRPEQRVLVGTLSNLTALAAAQQVQPPAILYVGEVAALAAEGCWFNGPALTLPEQEAQRA